MQRSEIKFRLVQNELSIVQFSLHDKQSTVLLCCFMFKEYGLSEKSTTQTFTRNAKIHCQIQYLKQ